MPPVASGTLGSANIQSVSSGTGNNAEREDSNESGSVTVDHLSAAEPARQATRNQRVSGQQGVSIRMGHVPVTKTFVAKHLTGPIGCKVHQ